MGAMQDEALGRIFLLASLRVDICNKLESFTVNVCWPGRLSISVSPFVMPWSLLPQYVAAPEAQ